MDAAPEREVGIVRAADIEPVGRLEHVRVPVGGADRDGDVVARADLEAARRGAGAHAPRGHLYRGIEARKLVDGPAECPTGRRVTDRMRANRPG